MGRSRGGLTTKIHALVDADGRPVKLMLTPGQAGDAPAAASLLEDLAPGATFIADRAYDTNAIRDLAAERGAWANIHFSRLDPQGQLRLLQLGLPPAKLGRALLQPDQTVPWPRHPLRPKTRELPRRASACRHPHLACS